ncbi:diacylglycerol kinase family lipid kinase, partial [Enterococcus entomosocium]
LEVIADERKWQGKTQLLTIVMSNSAGGFKNFDEEAKPDDGLFHIILLPKLNILRFILYLPRIIRGRIAKVPSVEYFTAAKVSIKAKEKTVHTRTDGDPTDDLPIEMKVIKHGLTLLVPEEAQESK